MYANHVAAGAPPHTRWGAHIAPETLQMMGIGEGLAPVSLEICMFHILIYIVFGCTGVNHPPGTYTNHCTHVPVPICKSATEQGGSDNESNERCKQMTKLINQRAMFVHDLVNSFLAAVLDLTYTTAHEGGSLFAGGKGDKYQSAAHPADSRVIFAISGRVAFVHTHCVKHIGLSASVFDRLRRLSNTLVQVHQIRISIVF